MVRPGRLEDVGAVHEIRTDAVEVSTAIWTTAVHTDEEATAWWTALVGRRAAYVACSDGAVVGYACWGPWRALDGYRHTVEDSVYVSAACRGHGIGRLLLNAVVESARASGAHVMLANIESGNEASIRLHSGLGFEAVGRLGEVGTKFGRWLDLTIMRLPLEPAGRGAP